MEVYSKENCDRVVQTFDRLIAELSELPDEASDEAKLKKFEIAIEELNTLSDEARGMIETGEREDLCKLTNQIAKAAGMDPTKYGDGYGPATIWRDW